MAYRIEITAAAYRVLKKLSVDVAQRIARAIDALARDPRPPGVKKLEGDEELYRVRVGDYRIVYQIQKRLLVVLVVTIGCRREVYRRRR